MARIFTFICAFLSFGATVASIVLYGLLTRSSCKITVNGASSDCPVPANQDFQCFLATTTIQMFPGEEVSSCQWEKRDLIVGFAACGVSLIYIITMILSGVCKSSGAKAIRIVLSILSILALGAAAGLALYDLKQYSYSFSLTGFIVATPILYYANAGVVILAGIFNIFLLIIDIVTKPGNKQAHMKIDASSTFNGSTAPVFTGNPQYPANARRPY